MKVKVITILLLAVLSLTLSATWLPQNMAEAAPTATASPQIISPDNVTRLKQVYSFTWGNDKNPNQYYLSVGFDKKSHLVGIYGNDPFDGGITDFREFSTNRVIFVLNSVAYFPQVFSPSGHLVGVTNLDHSFQV